MCPAALCFSESHSLFFQGRLIALYFDTKRYQEALALGECLETKHSYLLVNGSICLLLQSLDEKESRVACK